MQDVVSLWGARAPRAVVEQLTAGPVRLKFQDGELRYLYVGDREIVRRVYFAVRDSRWDTVMPELERVEFKRTGGRLPDQARRPLPATTSRISLGRGGRRRPRASITFRVSGAAELPTSTPRAIGLNVLFGSDSLAGTAYQTTDAAGQTTPGVFPLLVSPSLLTGKWTTLTYRTDRGMQVACRVTGADFGMEDQRNFGGQQLQSLQRPVVQYPSVPRARDAGGDAGAVPSGPTTPPTTPGPTRVLLGRRLQPDVAFPRIIAPPDRRPDRGFLRINGKPESLPRRPRNHHVLQPRRAHARRGHVHGERHGADRPGRDGALPRQAGHPDRRPDQLRLPVSPARAGLAGRGIGAPRFPQAAPTTIAVSASVAPAARTPSLITLQMVLPLASRARAT